MESKYTCIIIDDERHAIELLADNIRTLFDDIRIEATCSSWQSALNQLRTQSFDIVFLDISMPGKNGMELLQLIPKLDTEIIFVTAHEEYAVQAFEFPTSGYLVKPVDDLDLCNAITRALKRVEYKRFAAENRTSTPVPAQLGIPNNKGVDYININEIVYLESVNKCTRVVTRDKEIVSTNNLGKFKELTDKYSFFQVHRTFIINLNCIVRYESDGNVIMADKKRIPVARNTRNDFLKASNVFSKSRGGEFSE